MHRYSTLSHTLDRWLLNQRTSCPVCGLAAYCSIDDISDDVISQEAKFVAKRYEKIKPPKKVEEKSKVQNPSDSIIEIIGTGTNKTDKCLDRNVFESSLISFSSSACSSKHGKRIDQPLKKSLSNNNSSKGKEKVPLESFLFVQSISAIQTFSSSVTKSRMKIKNNTH